MASGITLSAGVRQNLLSLQNTANLMSTTQNRLATGKKVNSALDNPTNFFTAQSLQSRAGDMSSLLDNMTSGIKTLEAADNGLSAITKTVESMQSTLRQARQDKSFKTESYTIDTATIGTSSQKTIGFSGGAELGTTPITVNVNTLAGANTPTTLTGSGGSFAALASGNVVINGTTIAITGDSNATATTLTGVGGATLGVGEGGSIDITIDGVTTAVTTADADTLSDVATAINTAVGSSVADATSGQLVFTIADGTDFSIADTAGNVNGTAAALGFTGAGASSTNGTEAYNATAATVAAEIQAGGITGLTASDSGGQIALSLASGADITVTTGSVATAIGFGSGNLTSTNGSTGAPGSVATVDELVTSINGTTALQGKIRASNDNGKLRIENLSTADLTVTGVSTGGAVDGTVTTGTIGANTVRTNLVKQFNELRDQLDKLADDASYNGVNLLRGDILKLTFNETGTSTIEIQAKDEAGDERPINSSTLGIESATDADFDSDDGIDSILDGMKDALGTLRSQSSSFGSNLSIVENRTDFTKNMINTLQTGADSLVLADTNEEAANMLALQTRQQLSSTALSLASQADQAVLRLF